MPERSALSPAGGAPARWIGAGLTLEERPAQGAVSLRLQGEPERRLAAAVLGLDLSGAPQTAVRRDDRAALRLGPDEWLVLCRRTEESRLGEELRRSLDGYSGAAASIGNGTSVIEASGPQARRFLAKGTSIDLHPGVFAIGRCAVTGFGKIRVTLWRVEADRYALLIGRSFARSVWDWAVDVSREWAANGGRSPRP